MLLLLLLLLLSRCYSNLILCQIGVPQITVRAMIFEFLVARARIQ
jgi:hypothetical protein